MVGRDAKPKIRGLGQIPASFCAVAGGCWKIVLAGDTRPTTPGGLRGLGVSNTDATCQEEALAPVDIKREALPATSQWDCSSSLVAF